MGFRAWIGLWTSFILIVIVLTDCSALVKYITRFTEESFASLIAIIFIKESIFKLLEINKNYQYTNDPMVYANEFGANDECLRCVQMLSTATLSNMSMSGAGGGGILSELSERIVTNVSRIQVREI